MARPLRLQYPGALYHVTARGNERKAIFRSDADRQAFLSILSQAVDRYRLVLHAYVLMGNHYHVLVETREANLSLAIRHLNGVYTAYFNRTHRRVGHLFQGRFKAIVVEKESYLVELSRYIHLNPVRMKKGVGLGRYGWSSYRDYVGDRKAPGWLRCEEVLGYFGQSRLQARGAYRRYVEAGAKEGMEQPWEKVVGQVVLGGERFVTEVRKRVGTGVHREVPSRRQLERRPSWDQIRQGVRETLPELMRLKTGHRSDPESAVLMYLGRERGGLSLKELADLCEREESTISYAAGRVGQLRARDGRWDRVLRRIEESLISIP